MGSSPGAAELERNTDLGRGVAGRLYWCLPVEKSGWSVFPRNFSSSLKLRDDVLGSSNYREIILSPNWHVPVCPNRAAEGGWSACPSKAGASCAVPRHPPLHSVA